jgi:hypothetical protein
MTAISPLIIGGQGTYIDSLFYTEFPDRELSLEYMMEVAVVAQRFKYTHIIPSGGFTQSETPNVSEAASFENVWKEFEINLGSLNVVKDEVALDSAENVISGLMALRVAENESSRRPRAIGRIGFFSQWHFKKRRMTELARQLGIEKSFYFHGYAQASKAAAGGVAQSGEESQLDKMIATDDFLLLGEGWETKRRKRFKKGRTDDGKEGPNFESVFKDRWAVSGKNLDRIFAGVFEKLQLLKRTTIEELDHAADMNADAYSTLELVRKRKIADLQAAFHSQVIRGNVEVA